MTVTTPGSAALMSRAIAAAAWTDEVYPVSPTTAGSLETAHATTCFRGHAEGLGVDNEDLDPLLPQDGRQRGNPDLRQGIENRRKAALPLPPDLGGRIDENDPAIGSHRYCYPCCFIAVAI